MTRGLGKEPIKGRLKEDKQKDMMKYNTIPFLNIDGDDFVGMSNGEEFVIKAGETRYFPSFLSKKFANVLAKKMLMKELEETPRIDKTKFLVEAERNMLGQEKMTKTAETIKTFKEEVLEHEADVKKMMVEEDRAIKAKKIEALKIAK